MDNILTFINEQQLYITIALCALVLILIIVVITCLTALNKLERKYKRLMRGTNSKNIEELLLSYLDKIDEVKQVSDEVKTLCDETTKITTNCVQKVSIIRYKAFEDIGSDLSYSIAMLDGKNNGILITSIYGRNESTTYAKPIDNGISRYDLSEEEEKVLHQAINTEH
ncbi:hypothetical protein J2Z44_003411 [Clostridium punense]|uniref:DUF4446 family protein n=1 Tax=Clostridium punense TaxID=1054297 RepID=A0ABS4K714_9CLOT|nr:MULTISPECIES: DUF4446 family protein [Clostridium]EQB86500.1 hypothetical protein M918_14000 [Clostridium sp. BL8]MBP2023573.1 hypothetical protein [Clostridium punense]